MTPSADQGTRTRAGNHRAGLWLLILAGILAVLQEVVFIRLTHGLDHAKAEASIAAVLPLIAGLALPTMILLLAARWLTSQQPTRQGLMIIFAAGLAMRLVWFGWPAPLEDDFKRYMLDGAVVAQGLDPYRVPPFDLFEAATTPPAYAKIAAQGRDVIKGINFPDMRTIYPSSAQLSFALAYLIKPFGIDGLRSVFLAGEIATFLLLVSLLRTLGRSPLWATLYWWNPMIVHALIGIAHVDALIPTFVLGAIWTAIRGRHSTAMALVGAGAGIKIWPLLLAPVLLGHLRHTPRRLIAPALVLAAALALALGPVVWSALRPGSGLTAYAGGWSMNNAPFAWIATAIANIGGWPLAQKVMRVAIAIAVAAVTLRMAWRSDGSPRAIAHASLVVAATVFYLSPAQFPWYAVWFLPLAALTGSMPLLLASATLPAYYVFYPLWGSGNGDTFFYGVAFIHAAPVLIWLSMRSLARN